MAAAVTLGSCKKSSSDPNASSTQSMKFTINGSAVNYNTCLEASASAGSSNQTVFSGFQTTNGTTGASTFEVAINNDPATLKAGQTYAAATKFGETNHSALLYFPNDKDFYASQPGNPTGTTVTITDITTDIIKGTFSGKLFSQDDYDGKSVKYTVTAGTFVAKREK